MAKASYVDIVALGHNASRSAFEAGGGGGGVSIVEVMVDFGFTPKTSHEVSITTTCSLGQKVIMTPSPDSDEYEMDNFACAARVTATNTIQAFITAIPGPVIGQRNFNLLIG